MRLGGVEIPDWLEYKLVNEYGPDVKTDPGYARKALLGVLLQDYIQRNGPCQHSFVVLPKHPGTPPDVEQLPSWICTKCSTVKVDTETRGVNDTP